MENALRQLLGPDWRNQLAIAKQQVERNRMMGASGELRSLSPMEYEAAKYPGVMDAGEFAGDIASQPIRAGEAVGDAIIDPSIPNVTDAAWQTAMTIGKPLHGLKAVGLGLGAGSADDFGLFGGEALAKPKKQAAASDSYPNGYTAAELQDVADQTGMPVDMLGKLSRKRIQDTIQQMAVGKSAASTDVEKQKALAEQERLGKAVQSAEAARDRELKNDTSFATDTSMTKQVYDKLGGGTPLAAAFGLGALSRLGTGPGATPVGKAVKDYALPIVAGAGGAFGAMNIPQLTDMNAPTYNPKKAATLAYANELRMAGFEDEAQNALKVAADMLDENSVQAMATEQFYDNLPKRAAIAAIEGLTLGKAGASAVNVGGRGYNKLLGAGEAPQPAGPGPAGGTGTQSTTKVGRGRGGAGEQPPTNTGATQTQTTEPGQKPRGAKASSLSRSEKDAILKLYQKNGELSPQDAASSVGISGKESLIEDYLGEILRGTGKRNLDSAARVVAAIRAKKLALPVAATAAGGGAMVAGGDQAKSEPGQALATFHSALRNFKQVLIDLDGDGKPDVAVPAESVSPQQPINALRSMNR